MAATSRPDPRRALGDAGEDLVARWYVEAGYRLLDRNWRCREGELDVVVGRGNVLVFCEVKTRRDGRFGTPAEAVARDKIRRLRRLAGRWLTAHDVRPQQVRYDVVAVTAPPRGAAQIEHLRAAF